MNDTVPWPCCTLHLLFGMPTIACCLRASDVGLFIRWRRRPRLPTTPPHFAPFPSLWYHCDDVPFWWRVIDLAYCCYSFGRYWTLPSRPRYDDACCRLNRATLRRPSLPAHLLRVFPLPMPLYDAIVVFTDSCWPPDQPDDLWRVCLTVTRRWWAAFITFVLYAFLPIYVPTCSAWQNTTICRRIRLLPAARWRPDRCLTTATPPLWRRIRATVYLWRLRLMMLLSCLMPTTDLFRCSRPALPN